MRSDGDRWGIAESVGVTALGVAASRAAETRRPDGLVRDPYAEEFVLAAGPQVQIPFGRAFDDATGFPRPISECGPCSSISSAPSRALTSGRP